jgi:hypothetical protein
MDLLNREEEFFFPPGFATFDPLWRLDCCPGETGSLIILFGVWPLRRMLEMTIFVYRIDPP